jgi:hypothetical protein
MYGYSSSGCVKKSIVQKFKNLNMHGYISIDYLDA